MRVRFGRIGGGLVGCVLIGVLGLVLAGCDAPDIMPAAPPGAPIPRVSPDADAAQAQGEMAAPAIQTESAPVKAVDYTPAPPTAKGETKTTKRGVKYETLKEGTGPELKPGQAAQFTYVGKLLDGGTIFDDHTQRSGRPEIFTIGSGVIGGWQEALPGMKAGETRKLIIPPELGYGPKGKPPEIPPNATLLFEVELVKIIGS
jgi:FKBP-type peptidyl-prolyl cis-trans isomerase